MNPKRIIAVDLAAGEGTRMAALGHKTLVEVESDHDGQGRKPLAAYFLETANKLGIDVVIVINPRFQDQVKKSLGKLGNWRYSIQEEANGNAGALISAFDILRQLKPDNVLVVQVDDSALYSQQLLESMIAKHHQEQATITLFTLKDERVPAYFWQVSIDKDGRVSRVFEGEKGLEKPGENYQAIAGCFLFNTDWLLNKFDSTQLLPHGEKHELIIPDILRIALNQGLKIQTIKIEYGKDWFGANTPEELEQLREILDQK